MTHHRRLALAAGLFSASLLTAPTAEAKDRTGTCGPWKFSIEAPMPEESEPGAWLPCKNDEAFVVTCTLGDYIAGFRYFDGTTGEPGYRQLRFDVDGQSFEMWLVLEEIDNALTGHTKFQHPLIRAMRKGQKLTITDIKRRTTDILPLKGSGPAFAALLDRCAKAPKSR